MKVRLQGGEEAEASSFDGRLLTLLSGQAFAPGSPICFEAIFDDGARAFEGRVIGSKRVDEERFETRMRFVNLRREDRERLVREL